MKKHRLYVHLGILGSLFGLTFYVAQNCGRQDSRLKDLATTSSLKTGMFLPTLASSGVKSTPAAQQSATDLAKTLGWQLNAQTRGVFLRTEWNGESILMVDHSDGSLPNPVASLKGSTKYRWDSIGFKAGTLVSTTPVFLRYKAGSQPVLNVDNMFVIREAVTESGVKEPFIVPWTRNLTTENGGVTLWRVGDAVMNVETGLPVLKFVQIGRGMWRLTGPFKDKDLNDGSVFWSNDNTHFSSLTPGQQNVVIWNKQDDDSMDRVKTVPIAQGAVPAAVTAAVARGQGQPAPMSVNLGFDVSIDDPGVIRMFRGSGKFAYLSDLKGGGGGAVTASTQQGGFGLSGGGGAAEFESYVNPSSSGEGLGLSDGSRPAGLPSQYSNPKSLGQYTQIQQVTTGWWPYRATNDQSSQREYFYVERPDAQTGQVTRKVVYKDGSNNWNEESATGFLTKMEKLQNNASPGNEAALQERAKKLTSDASAQFKRADADSSEFVDKGFVGHMTDVGVAAGRGSLGPALKGLEGLDEAGKVLILGNATIAGTAIKSAASKDSIEKTLVNGGMGVATDIGDAFAPPGVAPGIGGAIKVGGKIAEGDTNGAIREGANSGLEVAEAVVTDVVPLDPISGAAVGAGFEGGRKVVEGGLLIQQLGSARGKLDASNDAINQTLQMKNDRDFSSGAGSKLQAAMFGNDTGNGGSAAQNPTPGQEEPAH